MAAATPGMGRPLARNRAAQAVFDEFRRTSGTDVGRLVAGAGDAELFADRAWELAIVATEIAAFEAFTAAGGVVSGGFGFSIGAYAALRNAGMVDVGQVVAMVDCVLDASRALPGSYGMAAITGPSRESVEALCRPGAVEVAAVLGEGLVLVAGEREATDRLCAEISPRALRVSSLRVRWPLHTTLMTPVAADLGRRREAIGRLRPLRHPVYSGLDGSRVTSPSEGWELLVRHLIRPQRLDLAIGAMVAAGPAEFVEMGTGSTLARSVSRLTGPDAAVRAFPPWSGDRTRGASKRC